MATINVTNERKVLDFTAEATKVSINGTITVGSNTRVDSMSGNIYYKDAESGEIIVGNFSLTNINMHADKYASYRTEASQLIDEAIAYVEAGQKGGVA